MRKIRKIFIGILLGATLFGSLPAQAAEVPAPTEVTVVDTQKKDTITWMTVRDGQFSISGENILADGAYSDTCSIDGAYVKGGKWKKNKVGWWYQFSDGTYPKNAAIIIKSNNSYAVSSWKSYKNGTKNAKFIDTIEIKSDGSYTSRKSGSGTFSDKVYYFDNRGYLVTSSSIWNHQIDENGEVRIISGQYGKWTNDKKEFRFETEDGKCLKTWYYIVPETGKKVTSGFYVIYPNNLAACGTNTTDGTVYCFDGSGVLLRTQYVKDGSVYRWAAKDGVVDTKTAYTWHKNKTGWWFGNAKWYAKSGSVKIGGVSYRFDANGYWID